MPSSIITRDEEVTGELLNESVLRSAAKVEADLISPESMRSTAEITTWNESTETLGLRIPEMPPTPVLSIAEQLVAAGTEEAEIERRAAATLD
jgi:hypothetical protein